MSNKLVIKPNHIETTIECNETILDAIRKIPSVVFETPCNGNGSCGKCRIIIDDGCVAEPADGEKKLLDESDLAAGIRLACYTKCKGSDTVTITIPEKSGNDVVLGDVQLKGRPKAPLFEVNDKSRYGIAVDIGTTTVVCILIDLKEGGVIAKASSINPQTAIGGDVLSRIAYTMDHSDGLLKLQGMIVGCLNELTNELVSKARITTEQIAGYAVAANCTMLHLLLGVDPRSLSCVPFTPVFTSGQNRKASDIGLSNCASEAGLYCLPSVSAYIGADIVAGIHVCDLIHETQNVMFIDIGTNGEIVLSKKGELWACSCAAGPAMEGMNISDGMRASDGAIESVSVDGGVFELKVIGDGEPKGICGSGVLETVAALLKAGAVDKGGRVVKSDPLEKAYYEDGKTRGYRIADEPQPICFTQSDVRQIQLAKGAILSGFRSLVNEAGIRMQDLDKVIIAGQFGSYLNEDTIINVGILPMEMRGKVSYIGNSSLSGAANVLVDRSLEEKYEELAGKVRYLELGSKDGYADLFMKCLVFPELKEMN